MKLIAETSIFSDQQVRDSFSEVRVTAEGIQQEVRGKVGNDEIISKINMSPEHIQIQSNRLEIDGTAVFNAIKPNIQNTLDGKKSIYTLKSGDAGGSNYKDILNFSAEGNIKTYTIDLSTPTTDIRAGDTVRLAYLAKDMASPGNQGTIVYIIGTVQEDPTSPTSITLIGHGLDTTVIDGGHILTGTIDANRISGSVISAINESNTGEIDANKIKTSDIKIGDLNSILGGTNLLKEIGAKINTTEYCCATIPLTEQLVANQPYTLQLWGVSIFNTPSTDKSIDIYWGGDTIYLGRIDSFVDGYGSLTFTLSSSQITHSDTLHYYINFYNSNAELTSYNFNITKWKLEKSDAPTAWSASPSDRVGKSNILRGTNQMKTGAGTYETATFSATQGTITHYNNDIGAITSGMLGYVAVQNYKNEPFEIGLSQKGIPAIYATVGLPYTISCWVKGNTEAIGAQVRLSPLQNAGSNPHTSRPALTTEWQYIFTTGVLTGTQSTSSIVGGFVTVPDMPASGILYVMGLKVEQGSSPTAWSGGTETDANSYITDIDGSGIIISSVNQNPSINAEGNSIKINGSGVYIYKNSIEQAHFIDSEVRLGESSKDNIKIDTQGIHLNKAINNEIINIADFNNTSIRLGESSKNNITIDTQGIHLYKIINNSITNIANFGDTIKIGIDNKQRIEINSTGFKGYDENNTSLLNISQNYISLGDANAAHIIMSTINSTNPYIHMYNNTSICFSANKDNITIGNETNGRSVINTSGLQVYLPTDLNHAVASFGSSTRIGYNTVLDQSYVYVSKSGFWIYRKDEDRNRSLFTINPPYFTLGEDDNLRMSINTTKGYIHMYTKDSNDNLQLSFNANANGVYIGPTDSGHSFISSDGLKVYIGSESVNTLIAQLGREIILGTTFVNSIPTNNILINDQAITIRQGTHKISTFNTQGINIFNNNEETVASFGTNESGYAYSILGYKKPGTANSFLEFSNNGMALYSSINQNQPIMSITNGRINADATGNISYDAPLVNAQIYYNTGATKTIPNTVIRTIQTNLSPNRLYITVQRYNNTSTLKTYYVELTDSNNIFSGSGNYFSGNYYSSTGKIDVTLKPQFFTDTTFSAFNTLNSSSSLVEPFINSTYGGANRLCISNTNTTDSGIFVALLDTTTVPYFDLIISSTSSIVKRIATNQTNTYQFSIIQENPDDEGENIEITFEATYNLSQRKITISKTADSPDLLYNQYFYFSNVRMQAIQLVKISLEVSSNYANATYNLGIRTISDSINIGNYSFISGFELTAPNDYQTTIGKYNKNIENALFVVGNGIDNNTRSNALVVTQNGETYSNYFYSQETTVSLETWVATGILTTNSANLRFTIPTGRIYPPGSTIEEISFNIVARSGNASGTGRYIMKNTSKGYDAASFVYKAEGNANVCSFYNGNNQRKTIAHNNCFVTLYGGTNIEVSLVPSTKYFFTGTKTINNACNNQPVAVGLDSISYVIKLPN